LLNGFIIEKRRLFIYCNHFCFSYTYFTRSNVFNVCIIAVYVFQLVRSITLQKSKTVLNTVSHFCFSQFVFYTRISVYQDKTKQIIFSQFLIAKMSSGEEVAICMWYILYTLEWNGKKVTGTSIKPKTYHSQRYCFIYMWIMIWWKKI